MFIFASINLFLLICFYLDHVSLYGNRYASGTIHYTEVGDTNIYILYGTMQDIVPLFLKYFQLFFE